jgi:hypothetical protein
VETIGVSNTLIKFAVLLLAIKEIWLLLGVPAFVNVVTSFLMMGQIPGTNHTMSPSEVIRLVVVLFVLLGLIIFRREITRMAKLVLGRQPREDARRIMTMPIPHPLAAITVVTPDQPVGDVFATPSGSPAFSRWLWRLRAVGLLGWLKVTALLAIARLQVIRYARIIAARAITWYAQAVHWAKIAAVFIAREAVIAWHWTEPYLRRFDAWLERKLHEYDRTATLLSFGSEMTSTVQKWRENVAPKESRK